MKILLLGDRGKMGSAITRVFKNDYLIVGKNTSNLEAYDFKQVEDAIRETEPDILINCIAKLGISQCEEEIGNAIMLNILLPRLLAEFSLKYNYLLVNFSTSAVFDGKENIFKTENDCAYPVNMYGITKYAGDCIIKDVAKRYYIFRIPMLFGAGNGKPQMIEKMFKKAVTGERIRLANDTACTPTYNIDVAKKMKEIIEHNSPYGIYHIVNSGIASLYDIIIELMNNLGYPCGNVDTASHLDFPTKYSKEIYSLMKSVKIEEMRNWKEAMKEYCNELKPIY